MHHHHRRHHALFVGSLPDIPDIQIFRTWQRIYIFIYIYIYARFPTGYTGYTNFQNMATDIYIYTISEAQWQQER